MCQGVVWFRLEVYFSRLKSSNDFSPKLIFGRSFFCTFVCNHGALILRLQVLALLVSVTMARQAKTSQKLNFTDWICDFELFDSYKSSNSFNMNAFLNFASVYFFLAAWFMFCFCL